MHHMGAKLSDTSHIDWYTFPSSFTHAVRLHLSTAVYNVPLMRRGTFML